MSASPKPRDFARTPMAETVIEDFVRDGAHLFPEPLDPAACASLLADIRATRRPVRRRGAGRFRNNWNSHLTTMTCRSKPLGLFRITRRIIATIFPADVLGTRFVRGLFLPSFIANDPLLRRALVFRLRHAGLSAMLAAHVLLAFQVVFFWHLRTPVRT